MSRRKGSRRPIAERLFARVDKSGPGGCWLWTGAVRGNGYGAISLGGQFGPLAATHRVSYEIHNGPVPAGLFVCHRCDVRLCVNPAHLFLGTNMDNVRDMLNKGRHPQLSKTHCRNGHPFSGANLIITTRRGSGQRRRCRACMLASIRRCQAKASAICEVSE